MARPASRPTRATTRIRPDFAFSLHNLPGTPLGHVRLKEGVVNCASRGMRIVLTGKTAHSSMPETGVSPMQAISELMPALPPLGSGSFADDDFSMLTVTHASMGEAVFGIAPGHAEVWATLRTRLDARMADLCSAAEDLARSIAAAHGLSCDIDYHEIFVASLNEPQAVAHLRSALDAEGVSHDEAELPMRASEDFGRFGHGARSAMFFLGSGERHPALHNPGLRLPGRPDPDRGEGLHAHGAQPARLSVTPPRRGRRWRRSRTAAWPAAHRCRPS